MSTALLGEQFLIFIYFYRIYPLKWKKPRVTVLKILSVFFEFVISYILNIILGPGQLRSSHIKFVDNKWNILFRSLFNVLLPIFNLPSIFLMKNNIIVTLLTLYTLLKKLLFYPQSIIVVKIIRREARWSGKWVKTWIPYVAEWSMAKNISFHSTQLWWGSRGRKKKINK